MVLLMLFAINSLILGFNIAELIENGFAEGKKLTIQIMNLSGWIFTTVFFFYFYIKSTSKKNN